MRGALTHKWKLFFPFNNSCSIQSDQIAISMESWTLNFGESFAVTIFVKFLRLTYFFDDYLSQKVWVNE